MASRGEFNSRIGFILAAAGSAVGLGNIWKFPFETGNGGGAAFLLMYLLFCFLLCFPVMVAEIAIGRKTKRNPVGAFKALGFKNWAIIGYVGVIAGILILSFYNVVAGWAFGYFLEMVQGNFGIGTQFGSFIADWKTVGLYGICFMAVTAFIVSKGVAGGIEKAAKMLMPTLFILIMGLLIYSLTLPNAMEGVKFYLVPDFSKMNSEVVYNALGQAFFSLSLGMGALITYGSYVSEKQNIVTSAALITLTDVGVAFLAGFMIFPFVFYQGLEPNGGPGLIFATLPGVFESLGPTLGAIVGSIFFLLLSFAALTSTVSLLEVPVAYVVDELKVERKKAVWGMAALVFVIGIPSLLSNDPTSIFSNIINLAGDNKSFMDMVEYVASDTFLPLGGCLISIFVAYAWKERNLASEVEHGDKGFAHGVLNSYIDIALKYICPLILGSITIVTILDRFFGYSVFG
jgi:neurotransmitter:Na+ symporter, NSS family